MAHRQHPVALPDPKETEHIGKRLDDLGIEKVKLLAASGGLPEAWTPHINAWMKDKV